MTGSAAADADGVLALRRLVKQRIERNHAVDLREGNPCLFWDIFQHSGCELFPGMVLLHPFENTEQRPRPALLVADPPIDKNLVFDTTSRHTTHRIFQIFLS